MSLIPPRRRPHATTVCAICAAIYLTTDVHTCTQETPTEGEPMTNQYPPPFDHPDKVYALPGDANRHQEIRLACLRLAAETGMPTDQIQATANDWTNFVLGTNQKEN